MRKGDRRRREIMQAAEKLFYEKGYEHTSIQDMLDAMDLSKGGFYHHFESKQAVMAAICEEKIQERYDSAIAMARQGESTPVERLNELFRRANWLTHGDEEYVLLLLHAAYAEDSYMLRAKMQEATLRRLTPVVDDLVSQGLMAGEFYTRHPELVGEQLLTLWLNLLDIIMKNAIRALDEPEAVIGVIDRIDAFRTSMELILNAPYGSIRLCEAEEILKAVRRLTTLQRMQGRMEEVVEEVV